MAQQTTGFAGITPYKAPTQTQNEKVFWQPQGTTVLGGQNPQDFLLAGGGSPDTITNRTVKVDGAYTRDQMGQMGEALSGQIGTVNNNVATGFTGLNENLNTGLTGLNTNLGTVNTGVTNVGNAVVEGNKANAAGFTGLNTALATQGTDLNKIGSNLTNYFTTLNAGQDAQKAQLTGLNSGFNDFRTDYDNDVTRADQARTQIQTGMQGGFNDLTDTIAKTSNATQQGLQSLSQPQRSGAQALMGNVAGNGFANYNPPGGGTSTQGANGSPANPQMIQGINAIRTVLATQGGNLDPNMANSFSQIAASFDQNGQLIPSTQGQGGVSVTRQMDQQGNLISAQKDANGQVLSQTMINMNASLMAANSLSQVQQTPFRTS